MAATPSKPSYPASMEDKPEKQTSITAHIVKMATITMSFAELDVLCDILVNAVNYDDPGSTARTVAMEFVATVDSLR